MRLLSAAGEVGACGASCSACCAACSSSPTRRRRRVAPDAACGGLQHLPRHEEQPQMLLRPAPPIALPRACAAALRAGASYCRATTRFCAPLMAGMRHCAQSRACGFCCVLRFTVFVYTLCRYFFFLPLYFTLLLCCSFVIVL